MEAHTADHKKIALALGSGSARGMAHIGVIQRLGELGIKPDIIVEASKVTKLKAGRGFKEADLQGHLSNENGDLL